MMLSFALIIKLWDTNDFFHRCTPDKMVMGERVRVEEIDENTCLTDPAASNEGVREVIIGYCKVINPKNFIDFDFRLVNFMLVPGFFSKDPQPELAVIGVNYGIVFVVGVLLNLLYLDVLIHTSADFLFESQLLGLHGVHLNPRLVLVSLGNCDSPCGVCRDDHSLDGVHRAHLALL